MTDLTNIIFRELIKAGYTTKGAALTWAELDANIELFVDYLNELSAAGVGNITPYNGGTTYDNSVPTYVSYNGNIYLYINASPSSGVVPDSDPLTWELVTIGQLIHQQNTDTILAQGTAYEISAQDIYNFISVGFITVANTTAFISLAQARSLVPNRLYYCVSEKIFVRSIDVDTYDYNGLWFVSFPDLNLHDVFDYAGSYGIGDTCYYNGIVYENITASISASPPPSDPTNWVAIAAYTTPEYKNETFGVKLYEVVGTFTILEVEDKYGNVYGYSGNISIITFGQYLNHAVNGSVVDVRNYKGGFSGNDITRNSNVAIGHAGIATAGSVTNCKFSNVQFDLGSGDDTLDKAGTITDSTFEDCTVAFPDGFSGSLDGVDVHLRTALTVNLDRNLNLAGRKITIEGGNAEVECDQDVYGSGTRISIESSVYSYLDIFTTYVILDTMAVNWDTITNGFPYNGMPYKLKPPTGQQLILVTANFAGIVADCFLYDGTTLTLEGDRGDEVTILKKTLGGNTVYQIIDVRIQA